jgi:uncharacterized membrane protein
MPQIPRKPGTMRGFFLRWPAALALVASLLGLTFAGLSSLDYTRHLDRQIHDVHCSYIPGLTAEQSAENACRVAMYSPFAALFRDRYWGGIPISLFAVGAFAFFIAFALYLLLGGPEVPRKGPQFFALFGVTPGLVSILMAVISALRLGHFCKTCVGIYIASALLAFGSLVLLVLDKRARLETVRRPSPAIGAADKTLVDSMPYGLEGTPEARRRAEGSWLLFPVWALALAIFSVTPALLYVSALPNYTSYITGCGKLEKLTEPGNVLLHVAPPGAVQPATLFVDPLCPTCKAFHQRLTTEGFLDQLDSRSCSSPSTASATGCSTAPCTPALAPSRARSCAAITGPCRCSSGPTITRKRSSTPRRPAPAWSTSRR